MMPLGDASVRMTLLSRKRCSRRWVVWNLSVEAVKGVVVGLVEWGQGRRMSGLGGSLPWKGGLRTAGECIRGKR